MHRRRFLSHCIQLIAAPVIALFYPKQATSAWLASHFATTEFSPQFQQLYAGLSITDTTDIEISLPDIAENGAVVPISISSKLDNIQGFDIWVEKNPTPLAAEIHFSADVLAVMTGRIKMAESCQVIVIAHQNQGLLRNQKWVNVMQGGCGTG